MAYVVVDDVLPFCDALLDEGAGFSRRADVVRGEGLVDQACRGALGLGGEAGVEIAVGQRGSRWIAEQARDLALGRFPTGLAVA